MSQTPTLIKLRGKAALKHRAWVLLITLGFALVQGQIGFLMIIRQRNPLFLLLIFIISVQASFLLEDFEQAFRCWIHAILLAFIFIFVFISIPLFVGNFPRDMIFIIIGANVSRVLVSVLIIFAPISFLGCFLGQILREKPPHKPFSRD